MPEETPSPEPLVEPIALVVGNLAERLSDVLGFPVDPAVTLAFIPPSVDTNWYANNAAINEANEAMWWTLSRPDRIILTRREIRETMTELRAMADSAKLKLAQARRQMVAEKSRLTLTDVVAPLAAEVETCEQLIKALRRTSAELEQHHQRLLYKFQRPTYAPEAQTP